jgi:hypothetical protein
MKNFYTGLKKTGLPSYAMPRLVRITKEYALSALALFIPIYSFQNRRNVVNIK